MIFTWYKVFNRTEFLATGLVSRTYTLILTGIGQKSILVTKGELVSMLYEGIFLPCELNALNPFVKLGEIEGDLAYAVIVDSVTDDVYLGIEEPDED